MGECFYVAMEDFSLTSQDKRKKHSINVPSDFFIIFFKVQFSKAL